MSRVKIRLWYSKACEKDLKELSKDKNCKNVNFEEEVKNGWLSHFNQRVATLLWEDKKEGLLFYKIRLRHPCLKKGKRGGLRLFYVYLVKEDYVELIFARLIHKPETEDLTEEEIRDALAIPSSSELVQIDSNLLELEIKRGG